MSLLPFGFIFKLCLKWCQNESYFFLPMVISRHFCLVHLKQQIKVIGRPPRNNTSVSVFNVTIFRLVKLEKTLGFKGLWCTILNVYRAFSSRKWRCNFVTVMSGYCRPQALNQLLQCSEHMVDYFSTAGLLVHLLITTLQITFAGQFSFLFHWFKKCE